MTSAHFGYAGPLTEALLLGVVANRFPETQLLWNAESMSVINVNEANELLRREYRDGCRLVLTPPRRRRSGQPRRFFSASCRQA